MEMFFLDNTFVHIKVSVMWIMSIMHVFSFKRTSESAITVIIMPIYEHVMSALTYEILAFKMRISQNF